MLQILVNKQVVQLLQPVPDVISVSINVMNGMPLAVPKGHGKPIMEWLYAITQRATGTIVYNGTILSKDQIKSPEDIFKGM